MRIALLVVFLVVSFVASSQVPQGIKYQAVARSSQGQVVTNQIIGLEIAILQGGPTGQVRYMETHRPTTNEFGLFTIVIGEGTAIQGTFSNIDWSLGEYFVRTSLDISGGNNYAFMGTSQLLSVPYALYAERTSKSDNDFDQDSTNELQTLDLTGTTLSISNGNSVQLGGTVDLDGDPTNEIQQLSLNGTQLNLSNGGGSVALPADNDGDPSNEIQQLSLNGNQLNLSNGGGSVSLPADNDGDPSNEIQTISSSATGTERTISLSQSNATTIDVADDDNDANNELQDLSSAKVGNEVTIDISNGVGTTINVDDADADPVNELQQLQLSGDTIRLSQNGGDIILKNSIPVETCIFKYGSITDMPGFQPNPNIQLVGGGNIKFDTIASYPSFFPPNQPPTQLIAFSNKVLLTGNYSAGLYNFSSKVWTQIPLPNVQFPDNITLVKSNNLIYSIGGNSPNIYRFDTINMNWITVGSFPNFSVVHTQATAKDSIIYITSGLRPTSQGIEMFECFTFNTNTNTLSNNLPPLPKALARANVIYFNNHLYVFNGQTSNGSTSNATLYDLDLDALQWRSDYNIYGYPIHKNSSSLHADALQLLVIDDNFIYINDNYNYGILTFKDFGIKNEGIIGRTLSTSYKRWRNNYGAATSINNSHYMLGWNHLLTIFIEDFGYHYCR